MRAIYRRQNCKAGIHLLVQTNFNFQILQYLTFILLTRSNNQWPLLWSDSTLTKALSILTRRGRGDLDWEVAKCTKHQPGLPQPPWFHYLSSLAINSNQTKLTSEQTKLNLPSAPSTNQAFLNPPGSTISPLLQLRGNQQSTLNKVNSLWIK